MFRENWKAWQFWRWWWHDRVPTDAKVAVAITLALGLLTGGYFASGHLTGANAATSADSYVLQSTITKVVTVKEHGRTVVKRFPVVVRRTVVRSHTSFATSFATVVDTRVVTTPGGVRYVTKREVKYVPVVRKRTVRVNGKTTTLTETRLVPTVQTQTLTNVVTNEQTVTNESTVVVNRTNTLTVPVTNNVTTTTTVTLPPDTVTSVQTVTDTVTVTLPVTTTVFVTT